MSIAKIFLINILNPRIYMWVDVVIIKKTQKAILVMFNGKTAWFPKAWILRIMHNKDGDAVKIKISQYHWEKKFY
ncbi:MAG: hypothetical protein Q8O13_10825 [Candidatus Omnitrophota bacterium]|nr:hypothetical protein [Candidatus Omnitrophota bacterium]